LISKIYPRSEAICGISYLTVTLNISNRIYDLSVSYKSESMGTGKMKAFMEKKEKYGAISRESISRAVSELLKARYIKKEARLMRGKAYITYTLTNKTRKLMDKYFRKD